MDTETKIRRAVAAFEPEAEYRTRHQFAMQVIEHLHRKYKLNVADCSASHDALCAELDKLTFFDGGRA